MKTFVTTVVLLLFLVPWVAGAHAQEGEEDPCAPEAQRSPQLMACAERQSRAAAVELKRARAELDQALEPRARLKLRAAERLWLRYQKSNCEAEASIYEGASARTN
jgi:uncharacterized protein YecT (DUF1311 family)